MEKKKETFSTADLSKFTAELASKAAVPGGGGASALVGAIGVSLSQMVCNLTIGKERYKNVEGQVKAVVQEADQLRLELLDLIDADAKCFAPLAAAYGIPKDDPNRDATLEQCLKDACSVPLEIMRTCARSIEFHLKMAQIGSVMAISDIAVGVICCKAAMQGASMNVYINTKTMKDRKYAEKLEEEADDLLQKYCFLADQVYTTIEERLRDK